MRDDDKGSDPEQHSDDLGQVVPSEEQQDPIAQFATTIRNPEEQIGRHVIEALQHRDTVAVLTTVVMGGDGKQQVVSAALSPDRMRQVQELLSEAQVQRKDKTPCVGFHCLIEPRSSE